MNPQEKHLCDNQNLPINTFLQVGTEIGRKILVVGESPAFNGWIKSGKAFYTVEGKIVQTGKELQKLLDLIDTNITLEKISFTEICKCFVGNNRKSLKSCAIKNSAHFLSQIEFINPSLIILLGLKTTEIFDEIIKSKHPVGELSEVLIYDKKYSVFPIFHTSPANPKRVLNKEYFENNLDLIKRLL